MLGARGSVVADDQRMNSERPTVGHYSMGDGGRWPALRGNWSKPPKRAPSKIKRLCIYEGDGFIGRDTEFLALFPHLHSVRISAAPLDLSGLYYLTELQDLWIHAAGFSPRKLAVLDLSRIPKLRRLSTPFFGKLRGLASLQHLTHLSLDHVYGTEELDFTPHRRLKVLDLGPANGVRKVCLEGLASLRSLTLACMSNLTSITGTEFYDTVTELDIRASNKIPASALARFRRLKKVRIGMKSMITRDNFPLCSPRIVHFPV